MLISHSYNFSWGMSVLIHGSFLLSCLSFDFWTVWVFYIFCLQILYQIHTGIYFLLWIIFSFSWWCVLKYPVVLYFQKVSVLKLCKEYMYTMKNYKTLSDTQNKRNKTFVILSFTDNCCEHLGFDLLTKKNSHYSVFNLLQISSVVNNFSCQ